MDNVTQAPDRIPRRGFTLSEMMVVLGLLVALTALTQPALRGALGDNRLRSAAKMVRVELAKARLKAMQSGVAQQFRHELGKSRFETASATAEDQFGQSATDVGRDRLRTAVADRDDATMPDEDVLELSLPAGVSFDDHDSESPSGAVATKDGWSDPIVFYPNGQTKSAHLRLKGERNSYVEVSLRGLTGVATAGKLKHDEDLR